MKKDGFGINIKEYCRYHEAAVNAALSEGCITDELFAEHLEKLAWMQHERLVHLIVTVMCVVCELFAVDLAFLHPELGVLPAIIMLILAVLLGFYFYHYFFIENTVQRWYVLADRMQALINNCNDTETGMMYRK